MAQETRLGVQFPSATVSALWGSVEAAERDIRERVILSLFADGQLSMGKAAELLGMPYADFMDLVLHHKVPWPYGPDDLRQDVEVLRRLRQQ